MEFWMRDICATSLCNKDTPSKGLYLVFPVLNNELQTPRFLPQRKCFTGTPFCFCSVNGKLKRHLPTTFVRVCLVDHLFLDVLKRILPFGKFYLFFVFLKETACSLQNGISMCVRSYSRKWNRETEAWKHSWVGDFKNPWRPAFSAHSLENRSALNVQYM